MSRLVALVAILDDVLLFVAPAVLAFCFISLILFRFGRR
jgi:hypothetical protein